VLLLAVMLTWCFKERSPFTDSFAIAIGILLTFASLTLVYGFIAIHIVSSALSAESYANGTVHAVRTARCFMLIAVNPNIVKWNVCINDAVRDVQKVRRVNFNRTLFSASDAIGSSRIFLFPVTTPVTVAPAGEALGG
jgi:hypothetical protein